MGTTRYTVIDGEILSENRNGVKRDYVPDPQGNTIALLDNTQTQTDTFSYYPYGEVASRTGTTQTPFQYLGTRGYYKDTNSRTYVRMRVLNTVYGRWMTQDPIGFDGGSYNLYQYAMSSPIVNVDVSGLFPSSPNSVSCSCNSSPYGQAVYPNDPRFGKLKPYTPNIYNWPAPLSIGDILCVQRAREEASNAQGRLSDEYPQGNGGPRDAFRHCVGSCLARRMCRARAYNHGIIDHEREDAYYAKGSWNNCYSPMDLANDEKGRKCFDKVKGTKKTCESCCTEALGAGELYVLPTCYWDLNPCPF